MVYKWILGREAILICFDICVRRAVIEVEKDEVSGVIYFLGGVNAV